MDDVNEYLTRFRPVTPPPALRERILGACRRRPPWRLAAAAILVAGILVTVNATIERRLAAALGSPHDGTREEPAVTRAFPLAGSTRAVSSMSWLRLRHEAKGGPS